MRQACSIGVSKTEEKKPDETVEKHANSDPEHADGPEFERRTSRFDTSNLLSAGQLNVRFITFSTVTSELVLHGPRGQGNEKRLFLFPHEQFSGCFYIKSGGQAAHGMV